MANLRLCKAVHPKDRASYLKSSNASERLAPSQPGTHLRRVINRKTASFEHKITGCETTNALDSNSTYKTACVRSLRLPCALYENCELQTEDDATVQRDSDRGPYAGWHLWSDSFQLATDKR